MQLVLFLDFPLKIWKQRDPVHYHIIFSVGSGDDTRTWGPPFMKSESVYFMSVNRNKKVPNSKMTSCLGNGKIVASHAVSVFLAWFCIIRLYSIINEVPLETLFSIYCTQRMRTQV